MAEDNWQSVESHKQKRKKRNSSNRKSFLGEQELSLQDNVLNNYCTKLCTKSKYEHDIPTCIKAHDVSEIRRKPFRNEKKELKYSKNLCPDYPDCHDGNECIYAHNKQEVLFHPAVYKSRLCKRERCKFTICAHAHGKGDLRIIDKNYADAKKERNVSFSDYIPSPDNKEDAEEVIEVIRDWNGWKLRFSSSSLLPCPISNVFSRILHKDYQVKQKVREICFSMGCTPFIDDQRRDSSNPLLLLIQGDNQDYVYSSIESIQKYFESCKEKTEDAFAPRYIRYLDNDVDGINKLKDICQKRKGIDISVAMETSKVSVWGGTQKVRHEVMFELRKISTNFALTDAKAIADAKIQSLENALEQARYQLQTALSEQHELRESLQSTEHRLTTFRSIERANKNFKVNLGTPTEWTSSEDYNEVDIARDSKEWDRVYNSFISSLHSPLPKVVKISRVQNPIVWQHYAMTRKSISNEITLWHGTVKESLEPICKEGFNRSYAGKNAKVYGDGTYFARDSHYSIEYASREMGHGSYRYLIQAKVLVGEYITGKRNMKEPKSESRRYDSAVNNIHSPSIYVVFKDYQAYPSYIVKFKS